MHTHQSVRVSLQKYWTGWKHWRQPFKLGGELRSPDISRDKDWSWISLRQDWVQAFVLHVGNRKHSCWPYLLHGETQQMDIFRRYSALISCECRCFLSFPNSGLQYFWQESWSKSLFNNIIIRELKCYNSHLHNEGFVWYNGCSNLGIVLYWSHRIFYSLRNQHIF